MAQLFFFTGGGIAHDHYVRTILGSVNINSFGHLLTTGQRDEIEAAYEDQPVKAWGAQPGRMNLATYKNLRIGDAVLA